MTKLTASQWDLDWVLSLKIYSWVTIKKNQLQEFDKGEVLLCRRYVDNIFCMFKNKIDTEKFFKYLNSKHPNIKFTMEKETNAFLQFLNVLFKNKGRIFFTSVYRKKTSIGLFTLYSSFTPFSYKIGIINCLIHRAFKISNSYLIFHDDINKRQGKTKICRYSNMCK